MTTKNDALIKAASAIEQLEKDRNELSAKVELSEKKERCEKLAMRMIEKGQLVDSVTDFQEKVAKLMREDDLDVWEKAIEINPEGLDLGNEDEQEKLANANGLDALTAFIVNSQYEES